VVRGTVPLSFILLPALVVLNAIFIWGAALFLGAFTPYFRDTPEFLRVFLTINVYLMPVMYTPDMLPPRMQALLGLNPFSYIIWCYQDAIYYGRIEHPAAWIATAGLAVLMLLMGSYTFMRLRHHIASVL
jgi:lipopolysaccharide transport system permease protein